MDNGTQMTIFDSHGEMSVFLHSSGDHVVIRYRPDKRGGEYPDILPHGSDRWDRDVAKAKIAVVFL